MRPGDWLTVWIMANYLVIAITYAVKNRSWWDMVYWCCAAGISLAHMMASRGALSK